jgi:hypothetical protein
MKPVTILMICAVLSLVFAGLSYFLAVRQPSGYVQVKYPEATTVS